MDPEEELQILNRQLQLEFETVLTTVQALDKGDSDALSQQVVCTLENIRSNCSKAFSIFYGALNYQPERPD